jgi:hypothetical protein
LIGLAALEPVDQAGRIRPADMIHHGPIGLHAVVIHFAFGHAGFLHQINDEPVLLASDAVAVVLSIGGSPDERVIASRLSMLEQESGFFLSQK